MHWHRACTFHSVRSYFETLMSKSRRPDLRLATTHPASRELKPSSGKVTHDDRGSAIWDWAIETGVLARTSSGELANKLADPARLTLESDERSAQSWDGDPYNRKPARRAG